MVKFFFLLFFNLLFLALSARTDSDPKVDSLRAIIQNSTNDTLKAKAYVGLSEIYYGSYSDSMILFCNKALVILDRVDAGGGRDDQKRLMEIRADAMNNIGFAFCDIGDVTKGLEYYERSLELREKIGNKDMIANSLNNIGIVYDEQGNSGKALDYYLKSLKLLEEIGEKYGMSFILYNIAFVYSVQGDMKKALDYHERSLKIRKELKDQKGIALSLSSIGLIQMKQGEYDKAKVNFENSLKIATEIGFKKGVANSLNNLGTIHFSRKEYDQAMNFFQQALSLSLEINDKRNITNNYLAISETHLDNNDLDAALSNGKKSMEMAKLVGHPELIREAADLLQRTYKQKGDYKQAYEMYGLYVQMRDSVLNNENKKLALQKEFQYFYEKKTAQDSVRNVEQTKLEGLKHEQEIRKQRSYTYGGIVGFILMLLLAGISFRAFRIKRKANQEIADQKKIVEEKQKEIIDSITYAKRIQQSHMPTEKYFAQALKRLNK